jgi:hypothetical protein
MQLAANLSFFRKTNYSKNDFITSVFVQGGAMRKESFY